MKILVLLLILLLAGSAGAQSVVITPNTVTYTRKNLISDWKKTFDITYPKVKAKTPPLSKKIEALLSYEKNFDFTLAEELSEIQWLEEASYEVGYNNGKALYVALSITGSAAYPSGMTKHVVVNTTTGNRATPATEFINRSRLAARINESLQKEIAAALVEIKSDKENEDIDPQELFRGKKFTVADLSDFSIDENGVTFRYRYNFIHAVMALEPNGEFKFSRQEIKPFLNPRGLLASIGR